MLQTSPLTDVGTTVAPAPQGHGFKDFSSPQPNERSPAFASVRKRRDGHSSRRTIDQRSRAPREVLASERCEGDADVEPARRAVGPVSSEPCSRGGSELRRMRRLADRGAKSPPRPSIWRAIRQGVKENAEASGASICTASRGERAMRAYGAAAAGELQARRVLRSGDVVARHAREARGRPAELVPARLLAVRRGFAAVRVVAARVAVPQVPGGARPCKVRRYG